MTRVGKTIAGNLDLIAVGVLSGALALAPFLGWGAPGDNGALSVGVAALVITLAVVLRWRDAGAVDLVGVPCTAAAGAGLGLLPTFGGFEPALLLPLIAGFVLGVRGGFAYGMVATAGAMAAGLQWGPWLPYQVLGGAWLGVLGGLAARAVGRVPGIRGRGAVAVAALAGGYLYGVFLNATIWTGLFAGAWRTQWGSGVPLPLGLLHFAVFYCSTALLWDTLRGLGLAILVVALPWTLLLRLPLRWRQRAPATA
jgi:energy-coupling factor transport system substrate-specific component